MRGRVTASRSRRPRVASAPSSTPSRQRRRQPGARVRWAIGSLVGLVAAVVLWVAFGPGAGTGTPAAGEPVERFLHVHGLQIPSWAPDEVYVSTHQGLLRIDADGVWRSVSEQPHDFMGFAASPTDPGVLYSSGHPAPGSGLANPIGFMVSTDRGATWTARALEGQVDFHAMAVQPGDGQIIYGWNAGGGLHRSSDAGHSWQTVTAAALEESGGALSLAVGLTDPDRVLAGTPTALLESGDGGVSWRPLLDMPITAVVTVADDPERLFAYAATADDGLLETRDGGRTWAPLGLVVHEDAIGHLAVHPTDPDTVYAGTFDQDLYRTVDGGQSWEQLAEAGEPIPPANTP